ncbi:hypothetical protein EDB84DRAFT_545099 [Lactarius hengduanensis]|nr:hypothetical protein EDB84DRAFT_545099 [Lactarius hengduanensis]
MLSHLVNYLVDLSSSQNLVKSGEYVIESNAVLETYSTAVLQQKIEHLKELISNAAPGTMHHKSLRGGLADCYKYMFSRTNDISDIEEAIKYSRLRLNWPHPIEFWELSHLRSLSTDLCLTFEHTNKIDYLDDSITLDYNILKLKSAESYYTIPRLVSSSTYPLAVA